MSERGQRLDHCFQALRRIVDWRLKRHFGQKSPASLDLKAELAHEDKSALHSLGDGRPISFEESITLAIALAPHARPHVFDDAISATLPQPGDFPQIGGVRGAQFRGFLPTGETVLFLLAGQDFEARLALHALFDEDGRLAREHILALETPPPGEPAMSGKLALSAEYVDWTLRGRLSEPKFGSDFPATRVRVAMDWEDLVLNPATREQLAELEAWIRHGPDLMEKHGMKKRVRPGYRALFHGPPGTGKTLSASLIAKKTGLPMYKIDLATVVSKFIGETEKNLAKIFQKAAKRNWILFFDEADAVFGKRTGVRDAHDKYANQEVSYLLQRIEEFDGLVILASNLKSNVDEAFLRRFQSVIHFPKPGFGERLQLWRQSLPEGLGLAPEVDLEALCKKHELSGSSILNVIQYGALRALAQGLRAIQNNDLAAAIDREYRKAGKVV